MNVGSPHASRHLRHDPGGGGGRAPNSTAPTTAHTHLRGVRRGDRQRGETMPNLPPRCQCPAVAGEQAKETARRQNTGNHPSRRSEVRAQISESQRAQWAASRDAPPSGFTGTQSEFRRLILPRLAGLQPRDLARATGLSPGYCAHVRDGHKVPEVRHWAMFQLAGLTSPRGRTHAR